MAVSEKAHDRSPLLVRLGRHLRDAREADLRVSVAELARRSNLSSRFLHDVESGKANISIERLALLTEQLGLSLGWLFSQCEVVENKPIVAIVGIRGAGKSTVGPRLAEKLSCAFHELDQLVEQEAGRPLAALFEDRGEAYFHELEARVLGRLVSAGQRLVLAAGGSIVDHPENYRLLRRSAHTVWLKATPQDHWNRVRKQGDTRPMRGRPDALAELTALWERRKRLYQLADVTVDTSHQSVEETVNKIVAQHSARTR